MCGAPSPRKPPSAELDAFGTHWPLASLLEAVDEYAIFALDATGAVQTWNRGAHRIKGYQEHEIVGRHFSVFYLPQDRHAGIPDQELAHATTHGRWTGEGWRLRKDGSAFWANVVITAALDADGELVGFVKITRDETYRRIAEKNKRELDVIVERERIAIQLSDATVHDIFAATLTLGSALAMNIDPLVAEKIQDAITALDRSLTHIRTTVTGLRDTRDPSGPTVVSSTSE